MWNYSRWLADYIGYKDAFQNVLLTAIVAIENGLIPYDTSPTVYNLADRANSTGTLLSLNLEHSREKAVTPIMARIGLARRPKGFAFMSDPGCQYFMQHVLNVNTLNDVIDGSGDGYYLVCVFNWCILNSRWDLLSDFTAGPGRLWLGLTGLSRHAEGELHSPAGWVSQWETLIDFIFPGKVADLRIPLDFLLQSVPVNPLKYLNNPYGEPFDTSRSIPIFNDNFRSSCIELATFFDTFNNRGLANDPVALTSVQLSHKGSGDKWSNSTYVGLLAVTLHGLPGFLADPDTDRRVGVLPIPKEWKGFKHNRWEIEKDWLGLTGDDWRNIGSLVTTWISLASFGGASSWLSSMGKVAADAFGGLCHSITGFTSNTYMSLASGPTSHLVSDVIKGVSSIVSTANSVVSNPWFNFVRSKLTELSPDYRKIESDVKGAYLHTTGDILSYSKDSEAYYSYLRTRFDETTRSKK
jgi:hypothetical protein